MPLRCSSLKATLPLFRVKFTNWPSSPLVSHIKENIPPLFLHPFASIYQGTVFFLMCGSTGDDGRFVNCTLKRGRVAFKDERGGLGAAERHRYFNDREKLLTEKSYFFLILCFDFTGRSF